MQRPLHKYVENRKKGKRHGWYKTYHPNGQESYTTYWLHGKLFGPATRYFEDGSIASINTYKDNVLHGWSESWDDEGRSRISCGEYYLQEKVGFWILPRGYHGYPLSRMFFVNNRAFGPQHLIIIEGVTIVGHFGSVAHYWDDTKVTKQEYEQRVEFMLESMPDLLFVPLKKMVASYLLPMNFTSSSFL